MKRWVALFALLLVGGLALAACGGDGDDPDETAARIVERLLRLGQNPSDEIRAYVKELPEDLPEGLPRYPNSKLVASFVVRSADQDGFFVIYDSTDTPDEVLHFFEEALDEDPWQVEGSTSGDELVALQFSKVDDANISGSVAIDSSGEDGISSVLLSVQSILEEQREPAEEPFVLGEGRELPSAFPAEVPVYPGATVTDTTWFRSPGRVQFIVTFLTEDAQDEVLQFYTEEFVGLGWRVFDEETGGPARAISFVDEDDELNGTIVVDSFARDDSYVQIDIQVTVSTSR